MRIFLAKVFISIYLCFHAYQLVFGVHISKSIQRVVEMNVEELGLHPNNKQFLNLYLTKFIAFCFVTSIITAFSKNLFPKMLSIFGIALWVFFAFHPKLPSQIKFMERCQHVAIAGAILFIAGSEYFEKNIGFEDFKRVEGQTSGENDQNLDSKEKTQ